MSLKVGITGGIGAGKSIVSEIFRTFGIPVYDADMMAKKLMNDHTDLKKAIIKAFGKLAYKDGNLNRTYLAQIVFKDEENLTLINKLVHPVVINDYNHWLEKQYNRLYSVKEAALLFESGSYSDLDKIIFVYAPRVLRINRVLMRDSHRTKSDIEIIMARQMSDNKKKKLSDYVIVNDEHNMLIPQVLEVHQKLMDAVK